MITQLINAIRFPDWINPTAIRITDNFGIEWYGIAYIVGIIGAYLWAVRTSRKKDLWIPDGITRGAESIPNKMMLEDFMFYCMLGIIVGGRLGSVLLYDLDKYIADPLAIFRIWEGGMAFHGGFAGVCLAALYVTRKYKVSLWRWADMAAIGAPLGLLTGRLANFVNQELWGRPTDVPWAFIFPKKDFQPRHPSQLYEAALEGIAIFVIIWYATRFRKALTRPGLSAGLFFLLYGVFRIFIEFFREPDAPLFGPFTRGMSYSLPMVIIGLCIVIWARKRPPVAPRHIKDEPKKAKDA